jgi:hypothetical protein
LPPEPVSPELVLIDPELARRERARLEEKAYLETYLENLHDVAPLRRASESYPQAVEETSRRRPRWRDAASGSKPRLVPAALICSLLVSGFLAADLVTRKSEGAAQVAVRMVTVTESAPSVPRTSTAARSDTALRTKAAVERRVAALLLSAPARKLPRNLVDPATGLVKNNLQVACTKKRGSFMCVIRLPENASKPLYVRYRTRNNRHGVFKWYGYRRRLK